MGGMEFLDQIIHLWEFCVENGTALIGRLFGFDPAPWVPRAQLVAALLAMLVSLWGLYNFWNHFDFRRRKLLANFLADEEKKILEAKKGLAKRFSQRVKRGDVSEPLDLHSALEDAVELFDSGKVAKAERELKRLQDLLSERQSIAETQSVVAKKQSAAIHLFLGSIAASQGATTDAKTQFQLALEKNADDLDAYKYLIEQHLILSEKDPMSKDAHLSRAEIQVQEFLARAAKDDEYKAEALRLQGLLYFAKDNKGNARLAFDASSTIAERLSNHHLISVVNEKLGGAWGRSFHKEAKKAYVKSRASYKHLGLDDDVKRVDELIAGLDGPVNRLQLSTISKSTENGSNAPVFPPMPKDPKPPG